MQTRRIAPLLAASLLAATTAPRFLDADEYRREVVAKVVLKTTTTAGGQQIRYPVTDKAEVTASTVEIAPGAETGWHRHVVPVYAWVVSGTLTVDYEASASVTVKAGGALVEAVGMAHNGRNEGTEPVKLLVFYTGVAGAPNVERVEKPVAASVRLAAATG